MAPEPTPKRSRVWLARAGTALIFAALLETSLWLAGYPDWRVEAAPVNAASRFEPDPETGWRNRAGIFRVAGGAGSGLRYTNWSEGRRATSEQPEEPAGGGVRPRAIFVGDAYTYGDGLDDEETFAWLVQQSHPELEVDNYGTPGYGTYQAYLSMYRAMYRAPDGPATGASVYYLFNGFHESRNVGGASWIRVESRPAEGTFFPYGVLSDGALEEGRTYGDVIWKLSHTLRTAAALEESFERVTAWPRLRQRRAVTEAILVRMQHASQLAGAKFTVILFDFDPPDRAAYRSFLASRGIAFLDCDGPGFRDRSLREAGSRPGTRLNELLAQWIGAGAPADPARAGTVVSP